MTPKLFEYIRHLSKQDRKTLSQKALKTTEEVGELAKVVLPYDNAYATTHRFTERTRILEEAVDTVLCSLSVAYDLDFTQHEIEDMMMRKAEKWAGLQAREANVAYPLPFEIHITVNLEESHNATTVNSFRQDCISIGIKPIILDLQNQTGSSVMTDVMTSSKHFGDNRSAYEESTRIVDKLFKLGYAVVRIKIETVPWHPAAPNDQRDTMPTNCYFESHIPVSIAEEDVGEIAKCIALSDGPTRAVHRSSNIFKRNIDGDVVVMLTYREYDSFASAFQNNVDLIVEDLKESNFDVGKVHVEFSVYDTKVSHDASWLTAQDK